MECSLSGITLYALGNYPLATWKSSNIRKGEEPSQWGGEGSLAFTVPPVVICEANPNEGPDRENLVVDSGITARPQSAWIAHLQSELTMSRVDWSTMRRAQEGAMGSPEG